MEHTRLIFALNLPIALGYLFRKFRLFSAAEVVTLRKFVVQVTIPFLIFRNLYKADISSVSQLVPSAAALLIMTTLYAVATGLVSWLLTRDRSLRNSYIFSTSFGNYAYLGWGVMWAFFGEAGFSRALFFTIFFWPVFLLVGFAAIYLLKKSEPQGSQRSSRVGSVLLKNALPPVLTATLALTLNALKVPLPTLLWDLVDKFGAITIPMILFTIGLSFSFQMDKKRLGIIALGTFTRIIPGILVGLAAMGLVSLLFSVDPLTRKVIVLQSVMPTAATSPFFSDFIETDAAVISGIMAFSTLFSLATIPLWFLVIQRFM
ncbi:AEC family transporter [Myxococcota bacterium]|nr:AEC family transporter [Myxococcota bacterium]MBU1537607.1 AEC family transporter [Myxococcota bacterium]